MRPPSRRPPPQVHSITAEASAEDDDTITYAPFIPRAAALVLKLQGARTQTARRAHATEADQGAFSGVSDDDISSSLAEAGTVQDAGEARRLTGAA